MAARARAAIFLTSVLLVAACGGGRRSSGSTLPNTPNGPNGPASATTSVSIGSDASVAKGRAHAFSALLTQDGAQSDCTATATWTSADEAVATVAAGAVTTLGLGSTTITATCAGASDSALLTVTAPEVVTIAVAPATGELPVGLSEQLVATATLTDGSSADVTADVAWTSDAPAFVSVSNAAGHAGVATAVAVGTATITATHAASGAAKTVTRTVVAGGVGGVSISSLAIAADLGPLVVDAGGGVSAPLGVDVQFRATATFSDGASADVTPSVAWSSSDPATATIGTGTDSGFATTLAPGTTTIAATSDALVASRPLTVTAAVPVSVSFDQAEARLTVGETLALACTATLSDDTTQPATISGATSSVPAVATVTGAGVVTAAAAGFATISGTCTAGAVTLPVTTQLAVVAPTNAPVLSYVNLTPGSVRGGKSLNGSVHLASAVSSPVLVTLSSDSANVAFGATPGAATATATISIPAGSTSASFKVQTTRPPSKRKVTITASLADGQRARATLNLRK